MEVVLNDNKNLKQARRALRHSGLRLTVRYGRIYTIKAKEIKQPRTDKQQRNWQVMEKANKLADAELRREGGKEEWEKRARETGYKTARGCVRAYYIKIIKEKMDAKERKEIKQTMITDKNREGWDVEKHERQRDRDSINEIYEGKWKYVKAGRSRIKKMQRIEYRHKQDADINSVE